MEHNGEKNEISGVGGADPHLAWHSNFHVSQIRQYLTYCEHLAT